MRIMRNMSSVIGWSVSIVMYASSPLPWRNTRMNAMLILSWASTCEFCNDSRFVTVLCHQRRIISGQFNAKSVDFRNQDIAAANRNAQNIRYVPIRAGDADTGGVWVTNGLIGILDLNEHLVPPGNLIGVLDAGIVRFQTERPGNKRLVRAVTTSRFRKGAVQCEGNLRHIVPGDLAGNVGKANRAGSV